jgi:ribose transport system substrate-binding protein
MKVVRSWRPIIMLCLLMLIGAGCSSVETDRQSTGEKNITLIVRMKQIEYWKTVRMGAETAAKEFNVKLEVVGPDNEEDAAEQVRLIDYALKDGKADALVLAANDFKGLSAAVDRAAKQGLPVINIDAEADSPRIKSFIGIDNVEAGRQAGRRLIELLGAKGRVAVVNSGVGPKNTEQRQQGVLEILRDHPNVEIAAVENCSSEEKSCAELTGSLLERYKQLDGIVALNSVSSLGVAQQVQLLGLGGQVKLVSFDSIPEEINLLQDGVIQATVVQNPFSMGYLGVKYAVDVLHGRKVPERVDTGTKIIDLENMFWLDNQKLLFPFVQ